VQPADLAIVVLQTAVFSLVALAVGDRCLAGVERLSAPGRTVARELSEPSVARTGLAVLVGFGVEAYVGVVLGALHLFRPAALTLAAVGLLLALRATLTSYCFWASGRLRRAWRERRDGASFGTAAWALQAGLLFAALFQQALAPVWGWDALAYHMPEAEIIVRTGALPLNLGGHWFYGNIPKLGEVLFAEGMAIHNTALGRALHVVIVGAFLLYLFGTVRGLYGRGAALLMTIALLLYDGLGQNAALGYVDGATASYEAAAVLATAVWVQSSRSGEVGRIAVLIGFALSIKYSAGASALFVTVTLIATVAARHLSTRMMVLTMSSFGAIVVATCGYWYAKNWVRFGNPIYPLYFGHAGVSETSYRGLLAEIQQFGPRSLTDFARFPKRFATAQDLPVFVALCIAPFAVFVRRPNVAVRVLLVYVFLFAAYWFFLGTHQFRFFAPAVVAAVIVAAVVLVRTAIAVRIVALAFTALAFVVGSHQLSTKSIASALKAKIGLSELKYLVGVYSSDEFLAIGRGFGCQYNVITFLRRVNAEGNVIDNWEGLEDWHVPLTDYYSSTNRFEAMRSAAFSEHRLRQVLLRRDFRWYYVEPGLREHLVAAGGPRVAQAIAVERVLLPDARLAWTGRGRGDECRLYRLENAGSQGQPTALEP
jgi:hypothetical protein